MTTNNSMPTNDEILRSTLFVPCETKDHLHQWIKVYLGLDIPNCIVCDDDETNPPSNSSPMDLIWEIYSKAKEGKDPTFQQVLGFAARDSFKTLSAAIIEVIGLFLLKRNVGHMAALESQAKNCQRYVRNFLKRPILREFVTSSNNRVIEITRYESGNYTISPLQYSKLDTIGQSYFREITHFLKIIMATVEDCNGLHVPLFIADELDLADPAAFAESQMIPCVTEDKKFPITFLTSTRKYSFGLVQKEIDNAHKSKLKVRHWNLIDVTQPCPPEKHLPMLPKQDIYYSETDLSSMDISKYEDLSSKEKEQYLSKEGYVGCLKNCTMFAMCKGRLATKQVSTSPLLKPIDMTEGLFQKVSIDHAKAQLLCWKPSSEGLIYPNFSRTKHMLSPSEMAERITGEFYPETYTKAELIQLMKNHGAQFYAGMDHGFTHNFAVVIAALIGHVLYVFDVISVPHLELQQKIDLCKEKLLPFNASIYPDNAYPADNKTFRRYGFRLVDFKKDVLAGVEGVRRRLSPGPNKKPLIYFLKGDTGCELLISCLLQYHWKVDAQGNLTDEPDKNDDDELDALRYLCQNVTIGKSEVLIPQDKEPSLAEYNPNKNWLKDKIRELAQDDAEIEIIGSGGSGIFFLK